MIALACINADATGAHYHGEFDKDCGFAVNSHATDSLLEKMAILSGLNP
jgi:hypothetical protein